MDNFDYQIELLRYESNISLSELEEGKAHERVLEMKYQKAKFNLDYATMVQKQRAQQMADQQTKMAQAGQIPQQMPKP